MLRKKTYVLETNTSAIQLLFESVFQKKTYLYRNDHNYPDERNMGLIHLIF